MTFARSLTSRLVLTATGLVALVAILVGVVTTVGLRTVLMNGLDDDVRGFAGRPQLDLNWSGLVVVYDPDGDVQRATYNAPRANRPPATLTAKQAAAVADVPVDSDVHTLRIAGLGRFRVQAHDAQVAGRSGYVVVNGLATDEVDGTVDTLMRWEVLLGLAGVLVAFGLSTWLVRRNLAPLREVADVAQQVTAQPLDHGEVGAIARVPDRLTDPSTEVGQVGSSLNSLLGHVESALESRQRSEQRVRQFVADASHELRTPLTTIRGYAELSQRNPGELPTAMTKVSEASQRMTSLVEDLLLLARLDSGRPLEKEPVDLSLLVAQAVEDAQVVAPGHKWSLELPDEPVVVTGDEQRLHQAVTNLLNNARRHTPEGTRVSVRLTGSVSEHGQASLTVHDDGPGIPPGVEVFERFSRGDSSRTRADVEGGGAGLGLSLVAAIVAAHEGRVSVRSLPGDTTFTVTLPVTSSPS